MAKNKKDKRDSVKINPNKIKSRDLVHLQEITHGSGTGYHSSKKDYDRKELRNAEKEHYSCVCY